VTLALATANGGFKIVKRNYQRAGGKLVESAMKLPPTAQQSGARFR